MDLTQLQASTYDRLIHHSSLSKKASANLPRQERRNVDTMSLKQTMTNFRTGLAKLQTMQVLLMIWVQMDSAQQTGHISAVKCGIIQVSVLRKILSVIQITNQPASQQLLIRTLRDMSEASWMKLSHAQHRSNVPFWTVVTRLKNVNQLMR